VSLEPDEGLGQAMPSLPRRNPPEDPAGREMVCFLSSVQSLYKCRAEVITTHAPSTSDACERHAQHVEKSISSQALPLS
jgi:hypothetical protein